MSFPPPDSCGTCGHLTYWRDCNGKSYCWPSCEVTKAIDDGRASWGENGNVVWLNAEPSNETAG